MTSSSSTGAGAAAAAAAAMQQPGFAISSFPLFIIFLFFAKERVHASPSALRPPPPPTDGGDQAGCLSDSLLSLSSSAAEAGAFGGHTHSLTSL